MRFEFTHDPCQCGPVVMDFRFLHPRLTIFVIEELKNRVERLPWIIQNIGERTTLSIRLELFAADRSGHVLTFRSCFVSQYKIRTCRNCICKWRNLSTGKYFRLFWGGRRQLVVPSTPSSGRGSGVRGQEEGDQKSLAGASITPPLPRKRETASDMTTNERLHPVFGETLDLEEL